MCDPADSSQLKAWLFSPEDLELCRQRGNRLARKHLFGKSSEESNSPPVECFARDISKLKTAFSEEDEGPTHTEDSKEFLNPEEENLLVSFYASKLPSLIGPMAQLPRLRRESKIPATAATLLRRFYLSNSVMIHDPKTIMVSAAFLASKVEDAMTDVRKKTSKLFRLVVRIAQCELHGSGFNSHYSPSTSLTNIGRRL